MKGVLLGIESREALPGAHPEVAVVVPENTQDLIVQQTTVVLSETCKGAPRAVKPTNAPFVR